ncbi:hypothetical protein HPB49_018286 [Dermacentor silvarum]|uniref:Uncharacterized protein n=1 Tax=Dermacentor silvarum TaxID=543639 RepID=A0ACB8DQ46_DERSI|nr:hypothetical protein HPB49_018286 [Dermacentor silvarum]
MAPHLRCWYQLKVASRLASHTLDYGKFSMSNAKVMKLERGMFGNLRFEYIQVKKSTVVQVDDGALEPSRDTLRRLEVVHCELKSFPFQNVSTFPKLESLSLQYNNLKAVPDYAFRYNPGLKKVDLSFNKIAYVGNYAFYYVPFLEELNLRNNKLKVLNNNAFAVHVKPNNDMVLDLSHNQIVLIAENAFHNENFRVLNMSHNRLRSFPEKHFRPLLVRMAVQLEGTIDVEGAVKMFSTFRAIDESKSGRHRHRTTEDILLATGVMSVKLQEEAARTLPQPAEPRSLHFINEVAFCLKKAGVRDLLTLVNDVWTSGALPKSWRHSIVVLIPKPDKKPDRMAHLFPISLTSVLCNLSERMVLARTSFHLKTIGWFHPFQTGFRSILYARQLAPPSEDHARSTS